MNSEQLSLIKKTDLHPCDYKHLCKKSHESELPGVVGFHSILNNEHITKKISVIQRMCGIS